MGRAKDGSKRGSAPGERRGGRAPGTPNRRTVEVLAAIEAAGYDPDAPFLFFAEVLREGARPREEKAKQYITSFFEGAPVWSRPTGEMMLSAARELAAYVAPKRKAIEFKDGEGRTVPPRVSLRDLFEIVGGTAQAPTGQADQTRGGTPNPSPSPAQRGKGEQQKLKGAPRPRSAPRIGGRR